MKRLAVAVEPLADDSHTPEPREHREAAPLLALVDVREVHLDERHLERLKRVVDRPGVVRPGAGVDDQPVGGAEGLVEEPDVLALVVRLAAADLQVELARPGVDLGLEVLDGLAPVDRLVAPPKQAEVDPVEDVDAHGATLVGDEVVECSSHLGGGKLVAPGRLPGALEQHEARRAADGLLVT